MTWTQKAQLLEAQSTPNAKTLNWTAWTTDPALANSGFTPVAQTLYVCRMFVDQAVASIHAYANCVAAGVGVSGAFIGIYTTAGVLLQQTADISSALLAIAPVDQPLPSLAAQTLNQPILGVLLINAATTMPQFAGVRANGGNLGLITNPIPRVQVNSTGTYSTLPSNLPALKLPGSGTFPAIGIGPVQT